MNTKTAALLLVTFLLGLFPMYSYAADLQLDDDDVAFQEKSLGNSHEIDSQCINDYRKLRNGYAALAGITPFVGVAGLFESAMLAVGWEYGGWVAFKAALGGLVPAVGFAIQNVVPGVVLVGTIVYETVMIEKFVRASHAYRLLKDIHGIGSGRMLSRLTKRVQKHNPALTEEDIKDTLLAADHDKKLCDGSLVHGWWRGRHHNSKRRSKRVAYLSDIEYYLLHK